MALALPSLATRASSVLALVCSAARDRKRIDTPKTEEEFNHDHQETCETARDRD